MPYDPIDFDAIVAPISEAEPAGTSSVFEVLDKMRAMRKQTIQALAEEPGVSREAEWNRIVELAVDTLQTKSKHLQVSVRLVESLARRDGFGGVRDGLKVLRMMAEQCWERMHPEIDPSDPSVRADPYEYLNEPSSGALFPGFLRSIPFVSSDDEQYSWYDLNAKPPTGGDKAVLDAFTQRMAKAKKAVELSPRAPFDKEAKAIVDALSELQTLVTVLNEKMGRNDAPGLLNLRESLNDCLQQIHSILKDKGGIAPPEAAQPEAAEEDAPVGEAETTETTAAAPPSKRVTLTRADVYERLMESAALLEKMEPHSPIPFLIRRAVDLGLLPFPDLMKELIGDEKLLQEMRKSLGIK